MTVGGGMVVIIFIIFSSTHIEGITLGACEAVYEIAGRASVQECG